MLRQLTLFDRETRLLAKHGGSHSRHGRRVGVPYSLAMGLILRVCVQRSCGFAPGPVRDMQAYQALAALWLDLAKALASVVLAPIRPAQQAAASDRRARNLIAVLIDVDVVLPPRPALTPSTDGPSAFPQACCPFRRRELADWVHTLVSGTVSRPCTEELIGGGRCDETRRQRLLLTHATDLVTHTFLEGACVPRVLKGVNERGARAPDSHTIDRLDKAIFKDDVGHFSQLRQLVADGRSPTRTEAACATNTNVNENQGFGVAQTRNTKRLCIKLKQKKVMSARIGAQSSWGRFSYDRPRGICAVYVARKNMLLSALPDDMLRRCLYSCSVTTLAILSCVCKFTNNFVKNFAKQTVEELNQLAVDTRSKALPSTCTGLVASTAYVRCLSVVLRRAMFRLFLLLRTLC